jgi:hypothetical protein
MAAHECNSRTQGRCGKSSRVLWWQSLGILKHTHLGNIKSSCIWATTDGLPSRFRQLKLTPSSHHLVAHSPARQLSKHTIVVRSVHHHGGMDASIHYLAGHTNNVLSDVWHGYRHNLPCQAWKGTQRTQHSTYYLTEQWVACPTLCLAPACVSISNRPSEPRCCTSCSD